MPDIKWVMNILLIISTVQKRRIVMRDEKEVAREIKNGASTIEVEGDLAKKIIKIKAQGDVIWGICMVGIAVVVAAAFVAGGSGGLALAPSTCIATPAMAAPIGILGTGAAISAVEIAIFAGGISGLDKLRKYKLEKISENKIVLHKN